MKYVLTLILGWSPPFFLLHAGAQEPPLAVKGLDPIALSQGKEIAGLESLETRHGLYRYRFANKESKAAFEARPEERGIQFGGACGKMGPFSGNGNPARFFVHDSRIYIFASESCRDSFKKDPEKHIERPNPVPQGSAEQRKRGGELVDLTLVGFGGAKRVDGLKTLQEITRHAYKQGDKETISKYQVAWAFPDRVRIVEEFSVPYGFVVDGQKGHQISGKESLALENSMREVAWRQALRQPLAMLKNRHAKGFVAIARGPGKVGETAVELLEVALHGATSTWFIEVKTGRILQVQYEARRAMVGDNVVKFADFRDIDGLIMPHQRSTFFNGKAVNNPEVRIERIVPNGELKSEIFKQSK
jgi:YHS domain-containing protein